MTDKKLIWLMIDFIDKRINFLVQSDLSNSESFFNKLNRYFDKRDELVELLIDLEEEEYFV